MRAVWIVVMMALAGCAGTTVPPGPPLDETAPPGTVRCIVVDETITPIAGATVVIDTEPPQETVTDTEGICRFEDIPPGIYTLRVASLRHQASQTTITVTGEEGAPISRIQLERLFDADPFVQQVALKGYMNCGFSAGLSGPCILDYTQLLPICPGGCLPILYGISGDVRRFVVPVEEGWQSLVHEMVWRPSMGTSGSMSLVTSFYNRTTSHTYDREAGPSPVLHRMDVQPGVAHPEWVPEEGKDDFLIFITPSTSGSGLPVALQLEQRFDLYVHQFYYGAAPDGWSFVAGDEPPY